MINGPCVYRNFQGESLRCEDELWDLWVLGSMEEYLDFMMSVLKFWGLGAVEASMVIVESYA